jgi:hypothetical protein
MRYDSLGWLSNSIPETEVRILVLTDVGMRVCYMIDQRISENIVVR